MLYNCNSKDLDMLMEKTIVKISGIMFLVITGFTAGSYYTMHKLTSDEYQEDIKLQQENTPLREIKRLCEQGEIITLKKKHYFCMPMK